MDRAEISRRLKAARWLRGGVKENGAPSALTVEELAQRSPLLENGVTANALVEIEQVRGARPAAPMLLEKIAEALDLPADWFTVEDAAQRSSFDSPFVETAVAEIGARMVEEWHEWIAAQPRPGLLNKNGGRIGTGNAGPTGSAAEDAEEAARAAEEAADLVDERRRSEAASRRRSA